MLDLFRAEMDAHLPALSSGLLALEKGRAEPQELEAMMRAAHSIKGAARIVGVPDAVQLAHALEDCFSAAQNQRLTLRSASVDVLLQGVDMLQRICALDEEPESAAAAVAELTGRIEALRDGRLVAELVPIRQAAPAERVGSTVPAELCEYAAHRIEIPAILDDAAAERLRIQIAGVLRQSSGSVDLDLSRLADLTATGLSFIASLAKDCTQGPSPRGLIAHGASPAISSLLRVTGLDRSLQSGQQFGS